MDASLWILLALVGAAVAVAFARDVTLPLRGLAASARLVRSVWIELALGFVLAGLLEVLLPQPVLSRWLGAERVGHGILIGWALTLARFVPGVLLPPVMGLLGQWLYGLFKRWG